MDSQALEVENELALAWHYIFKRDLTNAMKVAQKASTRSPQSAEVAHVLGVIASRDGRPDIALPLLQKSIEGGVTERRLRDMAEALVLAKHPQAALAPIQDCIKQFGESSESLGLLAAIYTALEEYALASSAAQKAISIKPEGISWQTTVSFCDLIQGQFSSGLPAFTFRNQTLVEQGRCPVLNFAHPSELWLKNEQGPGDTLFFLCHAKSLVEMGWRLHVQAHPKIQKVLQQTGLFASVELAFTCPSHGFWINIGDLPLAALQLGLPSPAAPLPLKVDEKLVTKLEKILQKFGSAPYIAVTWRGGVQGKKVRSGVRMGDRYIDTQLLGKTLSQTSATVISVQRVPDSKEANAFERALGRKVMDLSRLNDNLPEMLALMSIVDEYIAVPNTNHHLREALGKPSKIIVNRPYEDWRWSVEGNSQWYPYAQCYRQMADGSLEHVFSDIARDLNKSFPVTLTQPKVRHVANDDIEISHDSEIAQLLADGWAAVGQNDLPAAIQFAQKVMAIYPEHAGAFHLLGWSAMRDLKPELAVTLLKKGIEITPNDGRIVGDCIRALSVNEQFDEALNVAATALAREDIRNCSSIYYGRAALYLKHSNIKAAIEDYQQCMRINPNRLDAAEYSGMARLKLGDARLGFRESTARKVAQRPELLNDWCCPVLTPQHTGTRVLIKRDMGLGDELTYLRYLPWLTQAGMIVDYWCGKKLKPILERMGYFNHVYADNNSPPAGEGYDLSFIVNDLPVAVESLGAPEIAPPLPLTPRPELLKKWQAWLTAQGPAPYVGINWKAGVGVQGAGNIFSKLAKAVDTELFAKALSGVPATFISLQRNVLSDELKQFEQALGADLHDVTALTDDLDDLLALLSLLDENIGVSNTNMHLRASLAKGSRVMVQKPNGDWRWGVEGDQSIWFTQSIVYRQTDTGDWEAPLQVLQQDLQASYGVRSHLVAKDFSPAKKQQPIKNTKRLIWLTAGAIKQIDDKQTSELASARYRVIAPSEALVAHGWQSEIVNEQVSQVMGGWGSSVPQAGDTLIISNVFTQHSIKLVDDAKARGAVVLLDLCEKTTSKTKQFKLLQVLSSKADYVITANQDVVELFENAKLLITENDILSPEETQCWINVINATHAIRSKYTYSEDDVVKNMFFANKDMQKMKVLVGILYSGENEYEASISALKLQKFQNKEFFVIENLPNKLAHDTLYSSFMNRADDFDYFLKLDADMVFAHQNVLSAMVETMQKDNLAHLFAWVNDIPSGVKIPGIQMFKSDTKWLGSDEQLNVDYPPQIKGQSKSVFGENWINHMPSPDEYQLFRYGVHKALKSIQPDRISKNLKKGILHLTILNGMARKVEVNEMLWFALIGATLVYQKAFDSIEYNSDQTKKYFEILKTKPLKFEILKNTAKEFWSNEVQVNYWWVENFSKFRLS